ncbi:MAG: phosphatidylinositol-specific phospholipase C domain-containing protein [Alphaproteobacteria bacterium]|jgi:Phosphatidylinositol-specific phospholipase C, Y domain/Phosphatidylinositol-specific phospholipase C, X domain|uniref:PI-PLC Y-box domain-containing protein n=1 Tax=viral metagenome TaxID=1070528 RepID=A0A6C0HQV7_9ZZZZ|nr:phosphatidylinositol-specific phospholipase C domain-containing protein [Alphaproteobacteria bacterium]
MDARRKTTNIMDSIKNLNENFVTYMLFAMIILIVIIVLWYYFYMRNLVNRECSSMDRLFSTLNGSIKALNSSDPNCKYTFKDYYIKTAYNCCSPGTYKNDYVSTCALKDVLKQGVRGLDFEVFSMGDQPVVATSTVDSNYIKETYNYVPFSEVMNIITSYAFATSTAPNSKDPIVMHIRFKSSNQKMFQNFANLIKNYDRFFLGPAYSFEQNGTNFGNTPLLDLTKKNTIVLIVDKSNNSFMDCKDFYEYVNMTSNSIFMRALHYYNVKNTPDLSELQEFNKQNMSISMPDVGTDPPNPSAIVCRETGCQMIAMMYQKNDTNLQENNAFFDKSGYAFSLKPERLRYIPVVVKTPTPQNPALSFQTRSVKSDYYAFNI